jgi:predicted amidophosphoribosyltransferase
VFAICRKTGSIDRVLKAYKYADTLTGWAVILGRLVIGWLDENVAPTDYTMIVANPTHPSRAVRHTEAILEAARKEDLDRVWPILPDALVKTTETSQSATGNWQAKWNAARELEDAVLPAEGVSIHGRVLVFDDITTTCAQMEILARLLIGWGASHVDGLVIARTGA